MSPRLLPEIRDQYGYVVIMYPNDHLPAHVHVYDGEKVARIRFDQPYPTTMDSNGFRKRELDRLCDILASYRSDLITVWNAMHPDLLVDDD